MRRIISITTVWVLAATLSACVEETPTDTDPAPEPAQMAFAQKARYEYTSYSTDPATAEKVEETERTRTWTLVRTGATVHGRGDAATYVDSVFTLTGTFELADSIHLRQESGTNYVFRFASLAPELDLTGVGVVQLGRDWRREARLNAATAAWLVGRAADTVPYDPGIDAVEELEVSVTDSAVASTTETVTVDGVEYLATKTTHHLILALSVYLDAGPFSAPVELESVTLARTSWMVPELGAIVREKREGTVIDATVDIPGQGAEGITIPVPGYVSVMTRVLATGG